MRPGARASKCARWPSSDALRRLKNTRVLRPVVALLNYLAPTREPLRTYAYDPPGGGPRFNGHLQAHTVLIADARALHADGRLGPHGFTLCERPSAVGDFENEARLKVIGYPEAEALVRELTGARQAIVFDHTLRRRAPGRPPLDGLGGSFAAVREPVGRVHADYTPSSARERLRLVLGDEAAAAAMSRRFLIVGLWRPLNAEPLLDAPLALADARSLRPQDLVPNDLIYSDRRGQTLAITHHAQHRWFYFPRQRRDEVTVFKHFDSRPPAGCGVGVTAHTAFEDPGTPSDAPLRRSVELRAFALFDD